MKIVGRVESLWLYPVKSVRGEELQEVLVGFSGAVLTEGTIRRGDEIALLN